MFGEAKTRDIGGMTGCGPVSAAPPTIPAMEAMHATLNDLDDFVDGLESRVRSLAGDINNPNVPDKAPEPQGSVEFALMRLQRIKERIRSANQQLNRVI